MYYLGVDIGGTNIKVGLVDTNLNMIVKHSNKTNLPCSESEFCDTIEKTINTVLEMADVDIKEVAQIGMGCPGNINSDLGVIKYASNLGFTDFAITDMLESRFKGMRVLLENDANAAAYGEYRAGALQGTNHAVAITLGTGIGGGIIIDGEIYEGFNGFGGEMGHHVIAVDGRECNCGRKGCWERYSSATGLIKTTKEYMQKYKDSQMWTVLEGNIEKANGRTVFKAMKLNDIPAKMAFDEYVKYLSAGISNVINILQPEVICIGGGISAEGDTLLNPVRELCYNEILFTDKKTKIVKAELGNDAGIIGAALLKL